MKKIWFLITVLIFSSCIVSSVYAGSCFSDTIVQRWLEERETILKMNQKLNTSSTRGRARTRIALVC